MLAWMPWLVVGLCILGEAFFAAAEIAIVSANRVHLEESSTNGSAAARRVLWFRQHPDRLFGTTLIGTNLCTVTGSTVGSLTLMSIDPERGEWWAMLLMSPLILIGAELVPKSLAQARATPTAQLLSGPLTVVYRVLSPVIALVSAYVHGLYRVLGIEGTKKRVMVSREELALLMESEDEGDIEPDEREMISRIFTFSQLRARDSMVQLTEVVGIHEGATVLEASALIAQEGFSRLPVHRQRIDDIVGILHHLDLLHAANPQTPIAELMRPAYYVPETQEIDEILVMLQREAASAAIVVDEFGGAVGLLTLEDVIEEIVGDIVDEHDEHDTLWRSAPDGGYLLSGRATVEQLNDAFDLDLPEDGSFETIAGFALDHFRRIPKMGEQITLGTRKMTVRRASQRAILELHLSGPGPQA